MSSTVLRDQSYCVLLDGSIFSVHGDQNLDNPLLGDLAFEVDPEGAYSDGKRTYTKPYVHDSRRRVQTRRPPTVQTLDGSSVTFPGVVIDPSEIANVVTVGEMRTAALNGPHAMNIHSLESFLLGFVPAGSRKPDFGLTGSVGLGLERTGFIPPHDWDVVVTANNGVRRHLVAALQERTLADRNVRVSEYGKGWLIRQWVGRDLLCPFFRSAKAEVVRPTRIRSARSTIHGVVTNVDYAATVPVRFEIQNDILEEISVVMLGLRSRGDVRIGQTVQINGHWCDLTVGDSAAHPAFISIDDAPPILVDQPWENFYD